MKVLCLCSLIFYIDSILCETSYKFCAYIDRLPSRTCHAIQIGNSQVACVPVIDSIDCALKLQRKEAHFGVFSAEDALLASKFINDEVRVIGELRNRDWINETFAFQTVVVVKENYVGGFHGLQSTNYCHPGFGDGQLWTDRVLKEFEATVVLRMCSKNSTSVEQEVSSLANFFKTACRPGHWSLDDAIDKKLKKKYQSLCSLCDFPRRCAYNEDSQGSHKEALACLTENNGDVTYVALEYVKEYFGLIPGFQAKARANEYKFLCPDATSRPLAQPCPWIQQSWPLVVALKDKASLLKTALSTFLCKPPNCQEKWKEAFTLMLEGKSESFLANQSEKKLTDVLQEGRTISKGQDRNSCNKNIRLCTTNPAENSKCEWLQQAVIVEGIQPTISCVQKNSLWSCFDLIKKSGAEIVGIDSDYLFTAGKVFNLSAMMYQDNINQGNYLILPVVKANNSIKSFADLRGKRACFPEYNGLAWNSFVAVAKKKLQFPQECPYIKAVSEFFHSACVPGAVDNDHKDYNISFPKNLCSLCEKRNSSKDECEANSTNNKYHGDYGALACLADNNSDVAFVNYRNIFSKENEESMKKIDKNLYRILCQNGTLVPMLDFSKIDEECALSQGVGAEIVSRSSNNKYERQDIVELLLKMNERFGETISKSDNSIQMYGPFNGSSGLIFKDFTIDLVSANDQISNIVNKLVELEVSASEKCSIKKNASAGNFKISKFLILTSCLVCYIILK